MAAAVRVADAEGLSAVSMRRLARELGLATMSLYNYVRTKDDLLHRMADHVLGELDDPGAAGQEKQAGIMALARAYRDVARRHPWLSDVAPGPPRFGPHTLRYLDRFVGLLAGSMLTLEEKLEFIALVTGFALAYGRMLASTPPQSVGTGGRGADAFGPQVAALLDAARSGPYPHLRAALTGAGSTRLPGTDEVFDASVRRLMEGVTLR